MTKNGALITIILILLIIFGIYYWASSSPAIPEVIVNNEPKNRIISENPAQPAVTTEEASNISESSAVLNGTVTPRGVQTSYWFLYGETDDFGSTTKPQFLGSGYLAYQAPAIVQNLKPNTIYFYRLVAENQYGKVSGRIMSFSTATGSPPLPSLLPFIEAEEISNLTETSVTINGAVNPRGSETRYWFEYGDDINLGNATGSASAGNGTLNALVSANLRGLEPNQTYYYRLNAQNIYGTVNGDIQVFTTPAENNPPISGDQPEVQTTPATGVGRTIATLHGHIDANGSPTTYRFDYGKSTAFGLFRLDQSTDTKDVGKGTAPTNVFRNLTGLESGTTYYYQLVAQNEYGISKGSIMRFTTSTP